jgi:hypothetical protein
MAIGLGSPRETLRLTTGGHLVNRSGTADHTAAVTNAPLPVDPGRHRLAGQVVARWPSSASALSWPKAETNLDV